MEHGQTVFLIERMQPSWLETKAQQRLYSILVMLAFGLIFGLISGLFFGLSYGLMPGLIFGLICGLSYGLMGNYMLNWLMDAREILNEMIMYVFGSHVQTKQQFRRISGVRKCAINPAEVLNWSCKAGLVGLIGGLIIGLIIGFGLGYGLIIGLIGGLSFGLIFGFGAGEMKTKTIPNQGIHQSAKNAVIVWLIGGITLGGLSFGPIVGFYEWNLQFEQHQLKYFALAMWLVAGLLLGGQAVIQHFALRFVLYRKGLLPWNLVTFLDYATDRIFLRKVGGGYVFVHRMLMEYFADPEPGPEER